MRVTRGEAWWILRKRAGVSAEAAAAKLDLTPNQYRAWELDRGGDVPMPKARSLGQLTYGEYVALMRRRYGAKQSEAEEMFGVSRVTINRAERGLEETAAKKLSWQWAMVMAGFQPRVTPTVQAKPPRGIPG